MNFYLNLFIFCLQIVAINMKWIPMGVKCYSLDNFYNRVDQQLINDHGDNYRRDNQNNIDLTQSTLEKGKDKKTVTPPKMDKIEKSTRAPTREENILKSLNQDYAAKNPNGVTHSHTIPYIASFDNIGDLYLKTWEPDYK